MATDTRPAASGAQKPAASASSSRAQVVGDLVEQPGDERRPRLRRAVRRSAQVAASVVTGGDTIKGRSARHRGSNPSGVPRPDGRPPRTATGRSGPSPGRGRNHHLGAHRLGPVAAPSFRSWNCGYLAQIVDSRRSSSAWRIESGSAPGHRSQNRRSRCPSASACLRQGACRAGEAATDGAATAGVGGIMLVGLGPEVVDRRVHGWTL